MKLPTLTLTLLLVVVLASVAWCTRRGGDGPGSLVLDAPDWLVSTKARSTSVVAGSERAEVAIQEGSVISDMVPAGVLAGSIRESNHHVKFGVQMLIDAGVADDVARFMIDTVERHWEAYEALKSEPPSVYSHRMEMLFYLWPDLCDLMRSGKINLEVRRQPERQRHSIASGSIHYGIDHPGRTMSVNLTGPIWHVRFEIRDDTTDNKDLFDMCFK